MFFNSIFFLFSIIRFSQSRKIPQNSPNIFSIPLRQIHPSLFQMPFFQWKNIEKNVKNLKKKEKKEKNSTKNKNKKQQRKKTRRSLKTFSPTFPHFYGKTNGIYTQISVRQKVYYSKNVVGDSHDLQIPFFDS